MSASDATWKRGPGINAETRNQLVKRARSSKTRDQEFRSDRPTDWRPTTVRNPEGDVAPFFTPTTAWEFIAARLEAGEEVEVIDLRMPRGSKGYVMKIDLGLGLPKLYVKLQLVSKKVIGRSFHYSE